MKKLVKKLIYSLFIGIILFINNSCKKDDPIVPIISTSTVSSITNITANCGGTITSDGGSAVIARGVCWSIGQTPTIANNKTNDGAGGGSFTSIISGLNANTNYFVRAYATNNDGTGYGMILSFKTLPTQVPTLTTSIVTNITQNTAISGGTVNSDGGTSIISRGVCWSTSPNPTISDSKTIDSIGGSSYTSLITGLVVSTNYYIRAYATNSVGTGYGNEISFSTNKTPSLTTITISSITAVSVISGGNITSDGGSAISVRGVCYSTTPNPTIADYKTSNGNGIGQFISNLNGLTPNTKYYLKAYATNIVGTTYGNELSFTTQDGTIILSTTNVSSIMAKTANSGGNISNDGGAIITIRGVCYSTTTNPTILNDTTVNGNGSGNYTSNLTGLKPNTKYYLRSYATNSVGTFYGNEVSFTTQNGVIIISATSISTITTNSATGGGNITSDGGATITSRGICYSTTMHPTTANFITNDGAGIGSYTSILTGLVSGSTYYLRAYAINSVGTFYSYEYFFKVPYYLIGQNFAGGLIFYIDTSGQHGLVCAPTDQGSSIRWWNGTFITTNATGTNVGSGRINTTSIVNMQGAGYYAARICDSLNLNGFSDWYMPSKDELNLMFINLKQQSLGGFAGMFYWSSSEANNSCAWFQYFNGGSQSYNNYSYNKSSLFYVRAIRSF